MSEERARRLWLLPPASGVMNGIDLSLLDPADEDERHFLFLSEHPELWDAINNDLDEIELHGQPMSPRLHLVMHEVVANQLWRDDPPEMWATAQRLTELGYDRREVLHMLGSVVSGQLFTMMKDHVQFDLERTCSALAALPASWETLREDPPMNRAARRAQARRRF